MRFSDLPENTRVKLSEGGERELWHRVDEFGGIKALANAFSYSASKMYGWKSKDIALPAGFVQQVMGDNNSDEVILVKGSSTGSGIKNPEFPLQVPEELLTRIEESVKVNNEGTPTYFADERSLLKRFQYLLGNIGDIDTRSYSRDSRFELRYPKFVHELLKDLDFEEQFAAKIDETGSVEAGELRADGVKMPVEEFKGELYSREKRFELAIQRGESDKIAEMMSEETSKVRKLVDG